MPIRLSRVPSGERMSNGAIFFMIVVGHSVNACIVNEEDRIGAYRMRYGTDDGGSGLRTTHCFRCVAREAE